MAPPNRVGNYALTSPKKPSQHESGSADAMTLSSAKLLAIFDRLRASYWFIPAVMACAALIIAIAARSADIYLIEAGQKLPAWLPKATAEDARSTLELMASAIITVAGVVFSVTLVAISFAAGQYGPRLIGNMMRDQGSQISLGTFVAAFVYMIAIIQGINTASMERDNYYPVISMMLAYVFTASSVGIFIYFIHHSAEAININNITADVGKSLLRQTDNIFPDVDEGGAHGDIPDIPENYIQFPAKQSGFIQAVDIKKLIQIAKDNSARIHILYRPGDFVTTGDIVLIIEPNVSDNAEISEQILPCITLDIERNAHQNIYFLIDELVEILARALSPGINDPFTAIYCMNWMKAACIAVARKKPQPSAYCDDDGAIRLISRPVTFADILARCMDQSRPYTSKDRNAGLHNMKILADIMLRTDNDAYRKLILRHAEQLAQDGDAHLRSVIDRDELKQRYVAIKGLADKQGQINSVIHQEAWIGGSA
ncbi:DUF2254 domain-containing protein [Sphingorhabdus arenilitoris]|uniref:DUF2254 domain-containing protein n=1 Tax=Sphingorhabdus arenilitoris TaxID=1490041 RepID=A0ABV8RC86_9SPHN